MDYPIPIINPIGVEPILASSKYQKIFDSLTRGQVFCIEGTYGTAMAFYSWLKNRVNTEYPIVNYQTSRTNRDLFFNLSQRVLVRIIYHSLDLNKAPQIFWIKEFYPDLKDFYLPFSDILGINGAWQWFRKGIQFPGLGHLVHPYYGAYFPTRIEHLELFDKWLAESKPINSAIDMGTGCGVLSFYMLKQGVNKIIATDINPNALHSVSLELERIGLSNRIKLVESDMFHNITANNIDFVVFNPPWIPDLPNNGIDKAMYYQLKFFEKFFEQAYSVLPFNCRLVILFSTFAKAAGLSVTHPMEVELSSNNRFALVKRWERGLTQKPSARKHWLDSIRQQEKIELWELVKGK